MPLKLNTSYGLPKSVLVMGGACAAVVALLVFFAFGRLGFNPTDEGFYLAISRRLLEGLVPHRDFITPRPPLSAILHAPILLAGDYTLLLSRLIAGFQISITVWLGVSLLKEELAGTKIFGVLSGDVYHRIRYKPAACCLTGRGQHWTACFY